uniref:Uncharacterized protein n=1 Tax=Timema genevievae TaxID=629358 RepID=A0A7R9K7U6_TIMGE|nr:unnamed protein product [Timema genevievae]
MQKPTIPGPSREQELTVPGPSRDQEIPVQGPSKEQEPTVKSKIVNKLPLLMLSMSSMSRWHDK